ncbi:MAG TPA: acyltransferase family protein [Candidatus Eisenbergiella pullistercoris]|uniref:Acyltransferase family protein n=1 Tax=Candidatus Eisenbergiella pullistercoris TaxID=2838555 RepID=A0A9D1YQV0_9FIRM|nr:acyltransferase family protein [Candidatus Eisenbergiella pullistercoris]
MKQNQSTEVKAAERNYRMDNLKCLLIFAVVFGHMLELFMGKNDSFKVIYLVIYSFHMPLFAFISGVFARFSPEKIRNHLIYPYVVFQILYLLFANSVLEKEAEVQFTTPYWLLWYLFASIAWNLLLPLVQGSGFTWKKKAAVLSAAFLAGILIGFDNKAGYYLSFSRIVEFFPYFLLGVYYREWSDRKKAAEQPVRQYVRQPDRLAGAEGDAGPGGVFLEERIRKAAARALLAVCLGALLCALICVIAENVDEIKYAWLYGSVSYETGHYSWRFRLLSIGAALLWLVFFLTAIPMRKLPLLSHIGANTMPVYLLHGFLIKLMSKTRLFNEIENDLFTGLLISAFLVVFLSWRPLVRLLSPLMRWEGSLLQVRKDVGGNSGKSAFRGIVEEIFHSRSERRNGMKRGTVGRKMNLR